MRNAIFALVALAIGSAPAVALDGPGRALVASNNVRIATNAAVTGQPGASVGAAFVPPYSGTVRVAWEARSQEGAPVETDVGVMHLSRCSRTSSGTAFVMKNCTLRVAGGMAVNIEAFPDSGTDVVTLRRVELRYDVVDSTGETVVIELPVTN
jgi:hypothetical protein